MSLKVYEYSACSTCKNALKFLERKKIAFEKLSIVDTPPSKSELKTMLAYIKAGGGSFKNLFNTSGVQYRELGISEKIKAGMTEAEAIDLLAKNGKLIKRPFALSCDHGLVGFKEDAWSKAFA